ncbi:tetratricopeptide repeat protein [Mariprofundus micogutta]|uniref:Tetratricopeptide repeat protein n=1 Tax=Mariprofundus micogutta TaxID=1921010 RepID=A0A1L8CNF7_9PROT|nr:tetratricopeptide repeat protein [Mariprofundus micogutta]GAV20448.1 tetratricopeptide repeat protein [Mariprofundus micogutta]
MRLVFLLVLALLVTVALIVFPNIADQVLRLEAFGWIFETRQGAFIVALLVLLFALALLRLLVRAMFAGPGSVWRSLKGGSSKRRESRLREGLAQWLDNRGDFGVKAMKRSKGILPDWAMDMLKILALPAKDQEVAADQDDALIVALAARIATDPGAERKPDLTTRRAHLEAWLNVHPNAPLALSRMADVAEEEGDWPKVVELLESEWKQGHRSAHSVKPRLTEAYLKLAADQPDQAMAHLRKAYRLLPDNDAVQLAYGNGLLANGERATAQRLWTGYLEQHNAFEIAYALLDMHRLDAIRAYRKLEGLKDAEMTLAQRWLRAELAHAAALEGLAYEQMQALAEDESCLDAWKSLAAWHSDAGEYEKASACYQQALALSQ